MLTRALQEFDEAVKAIEGLVGAAMAVVAMKGEGARRRGLPGLLGSPLFVRLATEPRLLLPAVREILAENFTRHLTVITTEPGLCVRLPRRRFCIANATPRSARR